MIFSNCNQIISDFSKLRKLVSFVNTSPPGLYIRTESTGTLQMGCSKNNKQFG